MKTKKKVNGASLKRVVTRRRPTVKDMWDELLERRLIGGMLANCAFNLSQERARLRDRECEVLKELQTKWDAIKGV